MELKGFFPTGILFHQVPNQITDQIESLVVSRLNKLEYKETVKTDYFQTPIVSKEELKDLIKEVYKCATYYAQELKENFSSYTYWIQDYSKNDCHKIHNHGRNLFSVVYWVRASKEAGDLVIYEPSLLKKIFFQADTTSSFGHTTLKIHPEKGKLILFPSYLDHEVLPGKENCIRTTIAFNIF